MIVVALLKLVNHLVTGVYLRSEVDEDLIVRGLGEQMIEAEGTVVIVFYSSQILPLRVDYRGIFGILLNATSGVLYLNKINEGQK